MIRPTEVDAGLNRLAGYFGKLLITRPAASAADLAELERLAGPLPRDLAIFFTACDGLHVQARGPESELHLWHVHEIESALCNPAGPQLYPGLIPIRGDCLGECDCVITSPGPVHGVVVRWDTWSTRVGLIGSSFGRYLENWAAFLIDNFTAQGAAQSTPAAAFDEKFTVPRDPQLKALVDGHEIVKWLRAGEPSGAARPVQL